MNFARLIALSAFRIPLACTGSLKMANAQHEMLLKSHGSQDVWWLQIAPVRAVLTFEAETVPLCRTAPKCSREACILPKHVSFTR